MPLAVAASPTSPSAPSHFDLTAARPSAHIACTTMAMMTAVTPDSSA
jgi:hypothetical protein